MFVFETACVRISLYQAVHDRLAFRAVRESASRDGFACWHVVAPSRRPVFDKSKADGHAVVPAKGNVQRVQEWFRCPWVTTLS